MSETTTQNGIVVNEISAEELAELRAMRAKKLADEKRAADAKLARIRANGRPTDQDGNEKPASLAYVHRLANLLEVVDYGLRERPGDAGRQGHQPGRPCP